MTRIGPVEADRSRAGASHAVPQPLAAVLARHPPVLEAHAGLYDDAITDGHLGPELAGLVGAAVAGALDCEACLAAHRDRLTDAGLDADVVRAVAGGNLKPLDAGQRQAVAFARRVVRDPGELMPSEFDGLRAVGYDDADILALLGVIVRAQAEATYAGALDLSATGREP